MSVSTGQSVVTELIDSFTGAPPDRRDEEFRLLTAALWNDGGLTDQALPAVPTVLSLFDLVNDELKGYLAILLGLLAEAEYPRTGEVSAAVREGIDRYLDLVRRTPKDTPLSLALRYLLSHFPEDRDRVLAAVAELDLDADDLSRLERAVRTLDRGRPDLGRVFPSPAVWTLDDSEREFDRSWISALTPDQVVALWENDTRSIYGSTGTKAYWAVCHGIAPASLVTPEIPHRDQIPRPADPETDIFGPHAAAFRCPSCGGRFAFAEHSATCGDCSATYPIMSGILDLTAVADSPADFQFKLSEMPTMGLFYEAHARPNFLRVSGSNWADQVTPADEDAYIAEHVRPVDGPVLDMAAGAGRWTDVLAQTVGAGRVIALDLGAPMLTVLRARLPEVPAVLASAADLPFEDASLGAVLCWNALQAFPDHAAAAIAEAGRCLRPGGTFSFLTFRKPPDPVYDYFQRCHRFPQHTNGLRLFDLADIKRWLADAGLEIREESYPGTFVLITAVR